MEITVQRYLEKHNETEIKGASIWVKADGFQGCLGESDMDE